MGEVGSTEEARTKVFEISGWEGKGVINRSYHLQIPGGPKMTWAVFAVM